MDDKFNRARLDRLLARCEKENQENVARSSDEECCVCLHRKATITALPCSHRVTCKACSVKLVQEAHESQQVKIHCPICRAEIIKFVTEKHLQRMIIQPVFEPIVPYDLNVPRALGRRCHSISTGSSVPIKRTPPSPAGPSSA